MRASWRTVNVSFTYLNHTWGFIGALAKAFSSNSSMDRFATPGDVGDPRSVCLYLYLDLSVKDSVTVKVGGCETKG